MRLYVANSADSVATVFGEAIQPGEEVEYAVAGDQYVLVSRDPVPRGHKIALCAVGPGETVIKYGFSIGVASRPIEAGQHVHLHNLESERGRGDLVDDSTGAGT